MKPNGTEDHAARDRIVAAIRSGNIPDFRKSIVEWLAGTATPAELKQIRKGRELPGA
jgi:hypothetical protein